jgi:hypothetical protein
MPHVRPVIGITADKDARCRPWSERNRSLFAAFAAAPGRPAGVEV